jgi:hypothetical protein
MLNVFAVRAKLVREDIEFDRRMKSPLTLKCKVLREVKSLPMKLLLPLLFKTITDSLVRVLLLNSKSLPVLQKVSCWRDGKSFSTKEFRSTSLPKLSYTILGAMFWLKLVVLALDKSRESRDSSWLALNCRISLPFRVNSVSLLRLFPLMAAR